MRVAYYQVRLAAAAAVTLAAAGCGARTARGAADLPPCVESGAAAVDTTGWQPAPGYAGRLPPFTLPPVFAPSDVIECYHGGALWTDTTAGEAPGGRVVGYCGEGMGTLGDVPDSVRRRTQPLSLREKDDACLLSFLVLGQQAALVRDHYRTYDGGTRWIWRTWPLEFWEDIHFYARSDSQGNEALFLRVLRTWRREPQGESVRLRPN